MRLRIGFIQDKALHEYNVRELQSWSSTVVIKPLYSAKGDIIVGSGPKTVVAVHVGADGTVLMADSTQVSGVKWGSSTAGPDANDTIDAAGAAGTLNTYARSQHGHQLVTYATAAADTTPGVAGAAGTATTAPNRGDHKHRSPGCVVAGTTGFSLTNTTTETAIQVFTVPGNTVVAGSHFRIRVQGQIDNGAVANTLTIRVRWGGVAGTQIVSFAIATPASAKTLMDWMQEFDLTVRTIGGSGTIQLSRWGFENTSVANTLLHGNPAVATIDTTANKDLVVTAQWTTARAAEIVRAEIRVIHWEKL